MRRLNVASCVLHRLDRSTRIGMTHRPPRVSSATPMSFDASAYPADTDDRYAASILHMYQTPAATADSVPPLTVAAASVIPSGVNNVDSTPVYARSLEQRVVTMEFVQVRMLKELRELTTRVCHPAAQDPHHGCQPTNTTRYSVSCVRMHNCNSSCQSHMLDSVRQVQSQCPPYRRRHQDRINVGAHESVSSHRLHLSRLRTIITRLCRHSRPMMRRLLFHPPIRFPIIPRCVSPRSKWRRSNTAAPDGHEGSTLDT
jgi:hypothetical protein